MKSTATAKEVHAWKAERAALVTYDERGVAVDPALDAFITLTEKIDAAEATLGGKVFRIPTRNLDGLLRQITEINKRAAKLEVGEVRLDLYNREHIENPHRPDEEPTFTEYVYVVLVGETPRVAGFEFAATLEHEDAGTIIRRVPSFEAEIDLTAYRDAKPEHCDHCGLVRNRKDTYIVHNRETGETKQVGRSCLRDFTGVNNPERFALLAERIRDLFDLLEGDFADDEFERGDGSGEAHFSTLSILAVTDKAIREYGWLSKTKAGYGETSTADWVERYVTTRTLDHDLKRIRPDDEARAKAEKVLAWLRSDEFEKKATEWMDASSDYLWNLMVVGQNDYVTFRRFGLICSAVSAYDREQEWQLRRERETAERKEKVFVGTEGKREVFELTLIRTIWIEDRYNPYGGSKPLYIFQDADGNEIKWFASNTAGIASQVQIDGVPDPQYAFEEIGEGATYRVKATVKRHEDNPKYGKSTIVTRAKIEAKLSDPASNGPAGSEDLPVEPKADLRILRNAVATTRTVIDAAIASPEHRSVYLETGAKILREQIEKAVA